MSLNKVQLIGRLGRDPELKSSKNGMSITNMSIATSRKSKSSSGGYQEETEWHRIVCFGKTAEFANKYLLKGRLVYVEGRLRTNSWQAKDGTKRQTTEVIADVVQSLDKPSERPSGGSYSDSYGGGSSSSFGGESSSSGSSGSFGGSPKPANKPQESKQQTLGGGQGYFDDDDIPF